MKTAGALAIALLIAGPDAAADAVVRPFGSWESPISARDLMISAPRFGEMQADGDVLYWVEFVAAEGRSVVMRRAADGSVETLTPAGFNVRTRVHEYGGGAMTVMAGVVYFTNFADQQVYRQAGTAPPEKVTDVTGARFANCAADPGRSRLICVSEDHRGAGEPRNTLVAIRPGSGGAATELEVLFDRSDFVAEPALSADGRRLAFLTWAHPSMPWDQVQLRVVDLDAAGCPTDERVVNDGRDEAALNPQWGPDGALYFVGDRDDWWNLYRWTPRGTTQITRERLELGAPSWNLGARHFAFLPDGRIVSYFNDRGTEGLALVDPRRRTFRRLDLGIVAARDVAAGPGGLIFAAGFPDRPAALARLDAKTLALTEIRGLPRPYSAGLVARARAVEYGTGGGARAHAFYYPPANDAFRGPDGERPPLIVIAHGGPTLHTTPAYSVSVQYWTSRGFAVLDLNYRGSSGFGRSYRRSLYGQGSVADVEDAVNGAGYAAAEGLADPGRLVIRGGSAGGLIVLGSLAFHDTFKAGANYFGVSDLEALRRDTHKFESRYVDTLVGGTYPANADLYRDRSPINHLDGFRTPLITLQGLDDKVVPPSQSERIVKALRGRGVPVAYLAFAGEGHGFRSADVNVRAREAELYFYGRVLGFEPAGALPPIPIDNMPAP